MPKTKSTLDSDMVRELARLLDETGLTEIEIEQEGFRVRVSRGQQAFAAVAPTASPLPPQPAAEVPAPPAPENFASHPGAVKSPMVGTAYRAPAPNAPPFVEVGSMVKQGQTLLIIEAMKTMNQIPAPRAGRVEEVLVQDGQPVEYGEPLMIIVQP